jgi:hypothetical protein
MLVGPMLSPLDGINTRPALSGGFCTKIGGRFGKPAVPDAPGNVKSRSLKASSIRFSPKKMPFPPNLEKFYQFSGFLPLNFEKKIA